MKNETMNLKEENRIARERISKKSYADEVSKYDYTDSYSMKDIIDSYKESKEEY